MKVTPLSFISSVLFTSVVTAADTSELSLKNFVDSLSLSSSFNPIIDSYWTGYPHHRRTPFALSPDGTTAYLAYLDSSGTDVHVQPLDPTTFEATGTEVTVTGGKEAGGLVAHNDGFALLTNEALPDGTTDAPADSTPVAVMYRFDAEGNQSWKTFLGGPGVSEDFGLVASPDMNGDLVYSEDAGYYAAYFVITAYTGDAAGHYGDAIRYVDASTGEITSITGASSDWGCSHNTGIAFEAASEPPFASICAEDQGAIWLNTNGQGMSTAGVKVSNENTTNGGSGEPMGGMGGSYSALARFGDSGSEYIFAWVSRGAIDLTTNDWMGDGYTHSLNHTNNRNVAIATFSDKNTLVGDEATSEAGAAEGDSQVNWVTQGSADCSNAHAAAFDSSTALVTWEEIENPICDFVAMGCRGTFSGSYFQVVSSDGQTVGTATQSMDTYVAGDMVTMDDGRICWPYVSMDWTLDGYVANPETVTKMSFACASIGDGAASTTTAAGASSSATAEETSSVESAQASDIEVSTSPTSAVEATETPEATTPAESTDTTTLDAIESTEPVTSESQNTETAEISASSPLATLSATSSPDPSSATATLETILPTGGQVTHSAGMSWPTEWPTSGFTTRTRKGKNCHHRSHAHTTVA